MKTVTTLKLTQEGAMTILRGALDKAGFNQTLLMSYSTKFASAMYGPFREAEQSSPVTIDGYRHWCGLIIERFGRLPVTDLTGRDLDRWYGELIDGGAGAPTVTHLHAVLRGMLRQAVKWGTVPYAATDRASPPAVRRVEIRPPSVERLAAGLAQLEPLDLRHAMMFAALTGLRRGELCGLWWSDVAGGVVSVRRSVIEPSGGGWRYKAGGKGGKSAKSWRTSSTTARIGTRRSVARTIRRAPAPSSSSWPMMA